MCHQEVVLFFGFFIALLCFPFCIIRSLLRPQKNLIIHNSNNVKKIDLKHYMSKPQEFYVPIIVASKRVLRLIWPNVWRIFKNLLYFLVQNFLISALIFLWSVTNMYNMQRVINLLINQCYFWRIEFILVHRFYKKKEIITFEN